MDKSFIFIIIDELLEVVEITKEILIVCTETN